MTAILIVGLYSTWTVGSDMPYYYIMHMLLYCHGAVTCTEVSGTRRRFRTYCAVP